MTIPTALPEEITKAMDAYHRAANVADAATQNRARADLAAAIRKWGKQQYFQGAADQDSVQRAAEMKWGKP